MYKRVLLTALCLLLALPLGATAEIPSAFDLFQAEFTEENLQLLLPTTWNAMSAIYEPPLSSYILYDETDTSLESYIMLTVMPKAGDLPDEVSGFAQEAARLFDTGEGTETTLSQRLVIDRMDAIWADVNEEDFRLLFIDDGDRYIFLMVPEASTVQAETFAEVTAFICGSVALLDNPHPPHYDASLFAYEPIEDGIIITAYTGEDVRVDIPPTIDGIPVIALADEAFYETPVQDVTIPDSVVQIGENVFSGCNYLRTVTLPGSIRDIPFGMFESCVLLQRIVLPEGLETIASSAFWGCMWLSSLSLPASLRTIDDGAFVMLLNLEGIEIAEGNEAFALVDGVLFTRDMARLLLYPANLTATFYEIPDGVQEIAPYAFAYASSLQDVVCPQSLTTIGRLSFIGVFGLRNIVIPENARDLSAEAFLSSSTSLTIYGAVDSVAEGYAEQIGATFKEIGAYSRP